MWRLLPSEVLSNLPVIFPKLGKEGRVSCLYPWSVLQNRLLINTKHWATNTCPKLMILKSCDPAFVLSGTSPQLALCRLEQFLLTSTLTCMSTDTLTDSCKSSPIRETGPSTPWEATMVVSLCARHIETHFSSTCLEMHTCMYVTCMYVHMYSLGGNWLPLWVSWLPIQLPLS